MTAPLAEVAAAVTRSGILAPMTPPALARMAGAVWRGPNIATLLSISAARWPHRIALVDERSPLTFATLHHRVRALAGGLRTEYGVGHGDPVLVMCRNGRAFVEAALAAALCGADMVLCNTEFHADALRRTLSEQRASVLICDAEFIEKVRAAGYRGPLLVGAGGAECTLEELIRLGHRAPGRIRPGRIVILTSGTTGAPKGVPRRPSVRSFLGPGLSALHRLGLRGGSTIVVGIPLFHGFGLAVLALGLSLGGTLVLRRRFDPEAALAATDIRRAEAWAVVPVMLQRVLDLPPEVRARYDTASLAAVLCGAAPLTPALAQRFMDVFGEVLCNGYGSSEIGIAALATPAELRAAPGTVGRPVAGAAVAVLDSAGRRVPAGGTGRICVGGAQGFTGYSSGHDKQRVAGLIDSGDLGRFDAAGRLFVVGRSDDMIISGGENVYPQAVENVLAAHPDVSDVAVLGVDDEEYGQRLVAYVVAATGSSPSVTRLREYLYPNVSRFERPRDIMITGEIPRNAAGKIDRTALRQQYGG
ncbi:AMP-binding protein [Nocardia sp. CC227C]|uniref:AMP-binding protein n=1 Tax=Nocardia sp. CC227C TaxID=3044562 RepID=UPI00278C1159|nr:AMP-binding protein [Nocardia sp. CC227C]